MWKTPDSFAERNPVITIQHRPAMATKIITEYGEGKTLESFWYKDVTFFKQHNDEFFPNVGLAQQIQDVINFEMRENDVFLATYVKAGTHWTYEVINMLINADTTPIKSDKESLFVDGATRSLKAKMAETPSPRVINSHLTPRCMPKDVLEKGIKIVQIHRNAKDVLVSVYSQFSKMGLEFAQDFDTFLKGFIGVLGMHACTPCSWPYYVKEWEYFASQHPHQILCIYYEDMKEDPVREILKINEFLECNRSEELVKEIADACSFDNMKQANRKKAQTYGDLPIDLMYRKGEVGDWKNWLTVAQNEQMDQWLANTFTNTDVKIRYTL